MLKQKGFIRQKKLIHSNITTSSSKSSIHMQHGIIIEPGSYFTNIDKNENHYLSIVRSRKLDK